MKKKILCLFTVLGFFQMNAQFGGLDSTFGIDGKVITNINNDELANSLVIQPDGKMVIAGYTFSATFGNDILCIRYNSDGTIDQSFGTNGIVTFDIQSGSDDKALSITIQNDNKLVIAGFSDNGIDKEGLVMRLNTDGSLDSTFGNEGKVLTGFSTTGIPIRQDEYRVVKIHALTGNIVVGGTSFSTSTNSRSIIARYTSEGVLDTSFASGGKYTALPNTMVSSVYLSSIEDLAIKSNGKITVAGPTNNYIYFGRLNENGTMDTTFSSDGFYHNFNGRTYSIVLNNDDSLYFVGDLLISPETRLYAGKLNGNGALMMGIMHDFGTNTKAYGYAIEKDSNGKLIVAGSLQDISNGTTSFLVGRLTENYEADDTFGTNGFLTTIFTNPVSIAYDMKLQADGKIVLVGKSGSNIALARYDLTTLDTEAFEKNSKKVTVYPNPANDFINVTLTDVLLHDTSFSIMDVNGRVVLSGILKSNNEIINIENLNSGLYFLNLEGSNEIAKIIKK